MLKAVKEVNGKHFPFLSEEREEGTKRSPAEQRRKQTAEKHLHTNTHYI